MFKGAENELIVCVSCPYLWVTAKMADTRDGTEMGLKKSI